MLKLILMLGSLLAVSGLAGCAAPDTPSQLSNLLPSNVSMVTEKPLPNAWWRHFDDATLNALVEQALADNFSLQSYKARVERSAALKLRDKLGLSVESEGDRLRWDSDRGGLLPVSASIAMSYELDLWKKLPFLTLQGNSPVYASLIALNASAISLSANVANTYFSLAKSQAELRLLERQAADSRRLLELVRTKADKGLAHSDEVLRQQQLVESSESLRIQAQARQQRLTHQLAVLVGQPIEQFELPGTLPKLQTPPPLPAGGLPPQWLQRRPDIQAAFLHIRSTDKSTAQAIAAGLPINLYSFLAKAALSPTELVQEWLIGLASHFSAPLLDKFDRYIDVNIGAAEQAQALAGFRQKVLVAIQEVEDALVTERHDRALFGSLSKRLSLARQVFNQLMQRYAENDAGYFEVFTALRDLQALEQQQLTTRLALMHDRVTVARALAGGWAPPDSGLGKLLRSASVYYGKKLEASVPKLAIHTFSG